MKHFGIILLGLVALTCSGEAQPFNLQNPVINGGAQVAHGGQFSVAGSSGQTTSGNPTGGSFSVQGGETSGGAPFTSPIVPTMVAMNTGPNSVLIGWVPLVPGYVLEFTDTLRSPRWFAYPFANSSTNQQSIGNGARQLFFRLRNTQQTE